MKIQSIRLRNYKRFHGSNIQELYARFVNPALMIVGANSSGKSSLLKELCPLPATRSDFEQHTGLKELFIEDKGHQFHLVSDFSSRTSPHKFTMDNVELNASGTTEVQTQLVEKYFGITPAIRDLVYQKVQICNLQKAQRKNLFLNINPLELGLILDTHKKAMSKLKDCKANLQHLYSRKSDIEGKLLEPHILEQHKTTKQQMTDQLMNIDKVLYALEQHVIGLRDRYREDLDYKKQCDDNHQELIPVDRILADCRSIMSHVDRYTPVQRGDAYTQTRDKLKVELDTFLRQKEDISKTIRSLSDEVNEYQKHLEEASGKSLTAIEQEIKNIDDILKKYGELPKLSIPHTQIEPALKTVEKIRSLCFQLQDLEVSMIPPDEITKMMDQEKTLRINTGFLHDSLRKLEEVIKKQEKDILNLKLSAGIPQGCGFSDCGLRSDYAKRNQELEADYEKNKKLYEKDKAALDEQMVKLKDLQNTLAPYVKVRAVECYRELSRLLDNLYFNSVQKWEDVLLEYVNNQPLKIVAELTDYIDGSRLTHERDEYLKKREQLNTEYQALVKSSGASREFLQKQIATKEQQIKEHLQKLSSIEERTTELNVQYALYLEYADTLKRVNDWETTFTKGERALMVSKAVQYWSMLGKFLLELKKKVSEELRKIETIVRDQEVLLASYNNEIVVHISKIENDKKIYEHIEMALSPSTGMPHKSMVKYLNALIKNVNFFLSQIWSFKLRVLPIAEDQALDYGFKVEMVNGYGDISQLSSGQTEILNFAWTMTILLQLKLLNKIPFFADELGRTLDPTHRQKLLIFLNNTVSSGLIEQLFLVNHYAAMITGFTDADIICLDDSNLIDLPQNVNENVQITHYGNHLTV